MLVMWCQWGREGEKDQMFLKKQDLSRKKKQNFILIRSTYSLVFIQTKFQECPAQIYMAQEKVCTKDFHTLTLLKENNHKNK